MWNGTVASRGGVLRRAAMLAVAAGLVLGVSEAAVGQGGAAGLGGGGVAEEVPPDIEPYQGRLVTGIRFEGLDRVSRRFAQNQLRTRVGQPFDWRTVQLDVRNLLRIGEFRVVDAAIEVDEALDVVVVYRVVEAPIVEDIEVVGNRRLSDQELAEAVGNVALLTGVPIDDFRINSAAEAIEDAYRDEGYFQAEVTVDESELAETGAVIFRIREGERLQVTAIRFEGNAAFGDRTLRQQVDTETRGIFNTAPVDEQTLDGDVGAVVRFYRARGYLDVRVGRRIIPSPNGREAIVEFVIEEGDIYTLREIEVRSSPQNGGPLRVLSVEQVKGLLTLTPGDVYGAEEADESVDNVRDALRQMGYIDARVGRETFRDPETNFVDLRLTVFEGRRFKTGLVLTTGHDTTQSKVVRRGLEIFPDKPLDGTAIERSERNLRNSGIFRRSGPGYPGPRVVVQPEDASRRGYRDVLVEVDETRTGSIGFGATVNSDAGVGGAIRLSERNFDIADTPDSLGEFLGGRAFRGAGQTFNVSILPGDVASAFSIGLSDPAIFETDYTGSGSLFFRTREFDEFNEERLGGRLSLGRRFGTRWRGSINLRGEAISIQDVEDDTVRDLFDVEGDNNLISAGLGFSRRTTDAFVRPTRGTASSIGIEQVGLLGGDFEYTRLTGEHTVFLTIDEDVLGRETVLSLSTSAGYIPEADEAPIFERFYLGGRSFRGFDFRGIGPVGVRNDTGQPTDIQVGGEFSFFAGAQVEKFFVGETLALVAFVDSGTIDNDVSFDAYRVSVGTGVRLYVPQLGPVPIALDFAIPLTKEDTDDTRIFSFFVDVPF